MSVDERRRRSNARLAEAGVPSVEGPPSRGDDAIHLPSADVALRRAMILALTGMVGDGLDRESAAIDLERWELGPHLTPAEAAFLANESPSAEQSAGYSYRQEGALAILWALGMIPRLGAPDPDAAGEESLKLLSAESLAALAARALYRASSEILDEEDFYRRYRAAYAPVVPPGTAVGMEPQLGPVPLPAVNERLDALEWLAGGHGRAGEG